jgi:hypothetical protein
MYPPMGPLRLGLKWSRMAVKALRDKMVQLRITGDMSQNTRLYDNGLIAIDSIAGLWICPYMHIDYENTNPIVRYVSLLL